MATKKENPTLAPIHDWIVTVTPHGTFKAQRGNVKITAKSYTRLRDDVYKHCQEVGLRVFAVRKVIVYTGNAYVIGRLTGKVGVTPYGTYIEVSFRKGRRVMRCMSYKIYEWAPGRYQELFNAHRAVTESKLHFSRLQKEAQCVLFKKPEDET